MTRREKPVPPREIVRPLSARFLIWIAGAVLLILIAPARSPAADWQPLVERLAADGFDRQAVEALFARPEILFEPDAMAGKLKTLIRSRSANSGSLASTLKAAVRRGYLTYWAISQARSYIAENRDILGQITSEYDVPEEIIVSILFIETNLGRNTGNWCVFNRLASMARCTDLEIILPYLGAALITPENEEFARRRCREKADWAYGELKALLLLADRDGIDPLGIKGSIYGAIGLCQFMPSNVFSFGIDGDQNGRIDPFAKPDALHSIANYLRGHGWRKGMNREGQHRIIFDYNHSTVYANTVLAMAEKIKGRSRTRH